MNLMMLFTASMGFSKELRYKEYPIEIRDGDRMVLSGLRANVRLFPSTKQKQAVLKVRKSISDKASQEDLSKFDALSFLVRRDGSNLIIETKGPDSKLAWSQWLKPSAPELNIDIEAPPMPMEIQIHDGLVSAQSWRQSLAINLVSGGIKTLGTEGLLRFGIQQGQVSVEKHHGRVEGDIFNAKLNVQDLEGDIDFTNFGGESNLGRVKGNIDLKSHTGAVNIAKSSGSVDFLSGRGALTLAGFEGPVRGQTDQGPVSVTVEGDAEVHIESISGPVSVKLPADSGALVRMQTDEGTLSAPDTIKTPGTSHAHLVNGRLPGEGPKGSVGLKSKAGILRVR